MLWNGDGKFDRERDGKKLKNTDHLLSYLGGLTSELFQYITRLNVGEAVNTGNWIKLRRDNRFDCFLT